MHTISIKQVLFSLALEDATPASALRGALPGPSYLPSSLVPRARKHTPIRNRSLRTIHIYNKNSRAKANALLGRREAKIKQAQWMVMMCSVA
ncbi:hypothetical protein BO99DRAFT_266320 [Aspergillus violaceofuscus CBS 115571]|uniref:Uncharacterized protein n=1 Tax=Aspergillus violaceofuscus (strain CBS 115571) TaxID=1450538 RepID=A0A2V5H047_ASPV1|nr:hypothetical protein BO99DRAFT_266320 [Aspergillus violaceofuscus CBS 115571]